MSAFLVSASLFRVRHYEQSLRNSWLAVSKSQVPLGNDEWHWYFIDEEVERRAWKTQFPFSVGERHKNRIEANEFEFMRLRYTCCQIVSGVDLLTWRFIPLSFLGATSREERELVSGIFHICRKQCRGKRGKKRGYNLSRTDSALDGLSHGLWTWTHVSFAINLTRSHAHVRRNAKHFSAEKTKNKMMITVDDD